MRRLFSTFACGAPGVGLLLLRLAAGGALLTQGVTGLIGGLPPVGATLHVVCAASGVLLIVGLWTPVVGAVAAIIGALHGFFDGTDAAFYALLTTLTAALALLGPGAWSIDARLFGWKRVEISGAKPPTTRAERPPQ